MSSEASPLRSLLRQRYGSSNPSLPELVRILELKKGYPWVQEYNRLVRWCDEYSEDLNRRTALGHASHLGLLTVMRGLLECGMDAKVRDDLGRTALHRVFLREKLREGHEEIVKMLLAQGVEVDMSDNYGRTPLSLARSNGHGALLEGLMRSRGLAESSRVQIPVSATKSETQPRATQDEKRKSETKTKTKKAAEKNKQDSSSAKNFDFGLFKALIQICDWGEMNHHYCNLVRQYGSKGKTIPPGWLIDTRALCLVKGQAGMRYAALSYVWGQAQIFKTQRSNWEALLETGSLRETNKAIKLPRTIREALQLCQGLDIAHLWVDSLCIIQDDEVSKRAEIYKMSSIYTNAYLTIIAASGEDADAGLPLTIPHAVTFTGPSRFLGVALEQRTPWSERGWTFQELALSRRWIMFLKDRCLWRCPKGSWGDWCGDEKSLRQRGVSSEGGLSIYSLLDQALDDWERTMGLREYYRYVREYNRRALSNAQDGLFAFLGVIDHLKPVLGSTIFGIPEKSFVWGMQWQPTDLMARRDTTELPTWSWVCWQGSISHFDQEHFVQEHFDPVEWSIRDDGKLRLLQPALNSNVKDRPQSVGLEGLSISQTEPRIAGYGTLLHGRTRTAQTLAALDHTKFWDTMSKDKTVQNTAVLIILDCKSKACGAIQLPNNDHCDLPDHPFSVKLIALSKSPGRPYPLPQKDRTACDKEMNPWELNELEIRVIQILESSRYWLSDYDEGDGVVPGPRYWYYNVMLVKDVDGVCYREGLGWVDSGTWEDVATEDIAVVLG